MLMAQQIRLSGLRTATLLLVSGLIAIGTAACAQDGVIAHWTFNAGSETQDVAGNGYDLTLRGESRVVPEGREGSCLESYEAHSGKDVAVGAQVGKREGLTPEGAFTIELWMKPKPEFNAHKRMTLLDKMYINSGTPRKDANRDYQLYAYRTGEYKVRFYALLGFDSEYAQYTSAECELSPDRWDYVAFTYDGAGTGRFYFNREPVGRASHAGRGAIVAGRFFLAIGDRYGSTHSGTPAYFDDVRISNGISLPFAEKLAVDISSERRAFVRMEPEVVVTLSVANDSGRPLTEVQADVALGHLSTTLTVPSLAPAQSTTMFLPVDTTVRPGEYTLTATMQAVAGDETLRTETTLPLVIVPRKIPGTMPVILWGGGDLERVKDIGFTHQLKWLSSWGDVWHAGRPIDTLSGPNRANYIRDFDDHLVAGVGVFANCHPFGNQLRSNKRFADWYQRRDRQGEGIGNVNGNYPEMQAYAFNVGASVVRTYGHMPALEAAMCESEKRDHTQVSFCDVDVQAYKRDESAEIPPLVNLKGGVSYHDIPDFPADRIIEDDDPILKYYRWFWAGGDGWPKLLGRISEGLKSTGRDDLWTWHDPAVRCPSKWGSGGNVDYLSQWTYSYPDPIKIGQAADELFAMAEGCPGQEVMKMTQVIWYRSGTAPKAPEDPADRAPWEDEQPDARFITISPDHMREAFWSKLSRPVQGIMYHGWGSLAPPLGEPGGYRFTNDKTWRVLKELTRDVIRPLGPSLKIIPDRRSDVALLESFASQMFAHRGTRGWGGSWEADMHLICQWAQLQPTILYEETILRDGLDDFNVLVMPSCDVLPRSVAEEIKAFQRRGGIVIADENLAPGILADVHVQSVSRGGKKADEAKADLQKAAAHMRTQLDDFYQRYGEASDPDIIPRLRQYGTTDYLFLVNDKRTFGDYVGHHGKVMEKGVPNAGTVTVRRESGYAYDLLTHKRADVQQAEGHMVIDVSMAPGGGKLFMITDRPIAQVLLEAPDAARIGEQVELNVTIGDEAGKAIDAVVPLHVQFLDPDQREAEFSGYYAAQDGQASATFDLASNDAPGQWIIRVTDLASGLTGEHTLQVDP